MKKSIFTFLCLLFGVCLTLTIKQTADAKGHIRYNLSEDGVLSFYGKGELKRADYLLSIEKDCIKKIVIGEGITSLGKNSFTYFPNAKKVILPSSLKKIGDNVFSYMSSMKTIKVPNLVISIGKGAFSDCDLLKKLVLPDSVTSIGKGAFSDCDSLKKLVLPASLKSWKKGIAQNCPSLSTVVNRSKVSCHLDDCRGWRIWKVNSKKTRVLPKKKTARARGKKIPITYDLAGGKRTGKLPKYYEYGTKLTLPPNIKRSGYELLCWYSEERYKTLYPAAYPLYYIDHNSLLYMEEQEEENKRLEEIRLTPCWFKFEIQNSKEGTVQIYLDGSKNPLDIFMYEVRYSEFEDMSSAHSQNLLGAKDNKVMGEITNLDRGKTYYFEFRTWEDHQSEIDSWMGKRKILVN